MKNSEYLVSIIMPTYNRADKIGFAINSVLNQSYSNWELIIVDDHSQDNTENTIRKILDKDSRIRYYYLEEKAGASGARNFGMAQASGYFLTFLDSDDEYYPSKIEKQLNLFTISANRNLGIVSCGAIDFKNGKEYNRRLPLRRKDYYKSLLSKKKKIGAGTPFLMVKSHLIKKENILFDEKLIAMEDWDFVLRIVKKADFDFVEDYLVKVNHHQDERLYTPENADKALNVQYNKYRDSLKKIPKAYKSFIKNAAAIKAHHQSIDEAIAFVGSVLKDFYRKRDRLEMLAFRNFLYTFHIKVIKLFYLKYFK